ncbi:MAG: tetratricopeptide repeat protein [Calditrichaeota bacterium]|nr:tetratricopeptide repeat protein [Calditrichota bacterium]
MFSLFSITPAEQGRKTGKEPSKSGPSHRKTVITLILFGLWVFLFTFGAITIVNPKWLQELSRPGIKSEAQSRKDYGDNYLRANNYPAAIANYRKALEIRPGFIAASVNLAITYSRAGDDARAEGILKDALRFESGQKGVVYYNLGELYERQKKRDEAIRCYQRALETGSQRDLIYRKLGTVYLAAEQYDLAREAFERALASQLDVTTSYWRMLQSGVEMFEDDTVNLPIIKATLARGIREEDLIMYDLTIIRSLQQRDPEIAKTHNFLGFVYTRLGDNNKAIEHFEESLKIWPGNADAKKNLQVLYQLRDKQPTSPPSK